MSSDVEGKLDFVAVADLIAIEGTEGAPGRGLSEPTLVQITHKRVTTGKDFWDALIDDPSLKHRVEDQVGREGNEDNQLRIVEFKVSHSRALDQAGAEPTPAGVDRQLGLPRRRRPRPLSSPCVLCGPNSKHPIRRKPRP
jgi:hypothetical protein